MLDLWHAAVGDRPTDKAKATAGKVNHDLTDQNIEAFPSRVEAFLQVKQDEAVSVFLNSSKQVILDKCGAFLGSRNLGHHKMFLHRPPVAEFAISACRCF